MSDPVEVLYRCQIMLKFCIAPVSTDDKTAVVAFIQAVLDGAQRLNAAGVYISEQLGILMSDQVEVMYNSHKRRDDKQDCSGCSHPSHLELCTEPGQGWRLTMHYVRSLSNIANFW